MFEIFFIKMFLTVVVYPLLLATGVCGFHASFNGTRPDQLRSSYDFIIVGGGSSGCRLADVLSVSGEYTVLLIEAGGVPPEASKIPLAVNVAYNDPKFDWRTKTVPQKHAMLAAVDQVRTIATGRVLGGGSTINFMAYQRGNRQDYDDWKQNHGATGWDFEQVLPIFKQTEQADDQLISDDFHGRSGALGVTTTRQEHRVKEAMFRAFQDELGLEYSDHNDGNHWGVYDTQSTTKRGKRVSSFNAFVEPHLHRENLHILLHSHVTKVLMEDMRAVGVSYVRDGQPASVKASREVILNAGALRSPHILMLSGIGDRAHLEQHKISVVHHLPGVGQNLQDHFGYAGIIAEIPDQDIPDQNDVKSLQQWLLDQSGHFALTPLSMGLMYTATGADKRNPDVELIPIVMKNGAMEMDLRPDVLRDFYGPMAEKAQLNFLVILQKPLGRGEVRLASSDALVPPRVDPKYFSHLKDVSAAIESGRQLVRVLRSAPMKAVNATLVERPFPPCAHFQPVFSDAYLECLATHHTVEIYHPCGTCKIGRDDDPMAVVDERLRVRGVGGLRVADNSVMPVITVGHLNAPAIMIGSKAGQLILQDHDLQQRTKDSVKQEL